MASIRTAVAADEQPFGESEELLRGLLATGTERGYLTFEEIASTLEEVEVTATTPAKPPADAPPGATATPAPPEAPSVATGDIGSTNDEQLTQAIDVLRGLSLIGKRATG